MKILVSIEKHACSILSGFQAKEHLFGEVVSSRHRRISSPFSWSLEVFAVWHFKETTGREVYVQALSWILVRRFVMVLAISIGFRFNRAFRRCLFLGCSSCFPFLGYVFGDILSFSG